MDTGFLTSHTDIVDRFGKKAFSIRINRLIVINAESSIRTTSEFLAVQSPRRKQQPSSGQAGRLPLVCSILLSNSECENAVIIVVLRSQHGLRDKRRRRSVVKMSIPRRLHFITSPEIDFPPLAGTATACPFASCHLMPCPSMPHAEIKTNLRGFVGSTVLDALIGPPLTESLMPGRKRPR